MSNSGVEEKLIRERTGRRPDALLTYLDLAHIVAMKNEDLEPYRAGIWPDCDLNTLHRSRHQYDKSRIKILSGSRFLSRKNVTLLSGHDRPEKEELDKSQTTMNTFSNT